MVIVIGKLRSAAGSEAIVTRAWDVVSGHTAAEEGVLEYSLFQHSKDRQEFTILEVWADAALLAAHSGTEHLAEFRATVYPVLEKRAVTIYDDAAPRPRG